MINLDALKLCLCEEDAHYLREGLMAATLNVLDNTKHGDLKKWRSAVNQLPEKTTTFTNFNNQAVSVGQECELNESEQIALNNALMQLAPWRKGPFSFFGTVIDTEWQSHWKWNRLVNAISSLKNRRVLDIGCGNAYHCWRMKAAGAKHVIGIDPNLLFACQFVAFQKYAIAPDVHMLPIGIEALPAKTHYFDTVFSMGVLYHRKSPINFLKELHSQLRPGGELVLETLVVTGDETTVMVPVDRYARMRNVWFIPSCAALTVWLKRCGFSNVHTVDESYTSIKEQRSTPWMQYESLEQSLDPDNHYLTLEQLPAPKRAVLIATRH